MKYVISIFIFFMITGWTSNISNKYTEAAGNYKIGDIKYIANECTNLNCTDEIGPRVPHDVPMLGPQMHQVPRVIVMIVLFANTKVSIVI